MSLQMGRSFSLDQAGPKVAEMILAAESANGQSIPDPAVPIPEASANGSDAPVAARAAS